MDQWKLFKRYIPLLQELVSKDLKTKYRRSILGYLWSLLNPLCMMLIVSAVFSFIFRNNIQNYPIYLIVGQTFWNFFSEATNQAMGSLIGSSSLMQKVYIPKYIFPLANVLSSLVNLLFSLLAVVIVLIFTQTALTPAVMLLPVGIFYFTLFCMGIGLILSIVAVYFRDMLHLYKVLLTALMYLTPIFYSVDAVAPQMQKIIQFNPLYHYIKFFRQIIYEGVIPSLTTNLFCFGLGVVMMVIGLLIFKRHQDGIILYL